jgi:predicted negative regulator of RcsB-dependent stress response
MKAVTVGSRWWANEGKQFIVLSVVTIEGYTWVHYREDNNKENSREYSCYLDSFLSRFNELPK